MDTQTRRLFMACDTEMVVMNADNGNIVTRIKVPSRADMNCFDPVRSWRSIPNRADSTMTVVHEDSPDKFTVVEKLADGRRRAHLRRRREDAQVVCVLLRGKSAAGWEAHRRGARAVTERARPRRFGLEQFKHELHECDQ